MKRPSRVPRIKQHTLTVNQLPRQALGQVFVGNRRCRDDDEICAIYRCRQIRADEEWRRECLCAIFHQLDSTALENRHQCALGTGEEPDFIAAKGEVRCRGATPVTGAENCNPLYGHEN